MRSKLSAFIGISFSFIPRTWTRESNPLVHWFGSSALRKLGNLTRFGVGYGIRTVPRPFQRL